MTMIFSTCPRNYKQGAHVYVWGFHFQTHCEFGPAVISPPGSTLHIAQPWALYGQLLSGDKWVELNPLNKHVALLLLVKGNSN